MCIMSAKCSEDQDCEDETVDNKRQERIAPKEREEKMDGGKTGKEGGKAAKEKRDKRFCGAGRKEFRELRSAGEGNDRKREKESEASGRFA